MNASGAALSMALLAGAVLVPRVVAWGSGGDSVAVNAGADPDYVRQKFTKDGPRAETYLLIRGESFGGLAHDASLEKARFTEIARVLGSDLAVDRYYPAQERMGADLLIVVHWGVTFVDHVGREVELDHAVRGRARSSPPANRASTVFRHTDFDDTSFQSEDVENANAGGGGSADNPRLLGYDSALKTARYRALGQPWGASKPLSQISEEAFGEDIFGEDERYFVILKAYDFQSVKDGRKGARPKLLWSVHFSIDARGNTFTAALPAMGKVAAGFFGRQTNGLLLDAGKVPPGTVEVGEPKVVNGSGSN